MKENPPYIVESKNFILTDETLSLVMAQRWANEKYRELGASARVRVSDAYGRTVFRPTKKTAEL